MPNLFNSVRVTRPKRTAFRLGHDNYFTSSMGRLTPVLALDGVPGDTFEINCAAFARFSPLLAPPFGSVNISTVFFAVPNRLMNEKFKKFITGYYQDTSGSSQFLKKPNMMFEFSKCTRSDQGYNTLYKYFDSTQLKRYSLWDYLGYRSVDQHTPATDCEVYRLFAFWFIFFEYFVDQNIGYTPYIEGQSLTGIQLRLEDGTLTTTQSLMNWEQFTQIVLMSSTSHPAVGGVLTVGDCIQYGLSIPISKCTPGFVNFISHMPSKCWTKDYFTSALPWAQKGNPVTVPVTINSGAYQISYSASGSPSTVKNADGSAYTGSNPLYSNSGNLQSGTTQVSLDVANSLKVEPTSDTSSAMFTINELRTSYALQSWLEKNARSGSRYIEQILSHFGVKSSDARLQRPEYLGGFKTPVNVNSIAQTSASSADSTPQGNLAGNAISAGVGKRIKFFCEEHCLIIGICYVQPSAVYSQGLSRLLTRGEFYDYYFPEFAHLGEQAIYSRELYNDGFTYGTGSNPLVKSGTIDDTFGYQSRYSEYKFLPNEVHGDFLTDSLSSWIFGTRRFGEAPTLSPEFLQLDPAHEPSLNDPFPVVDTSEGAYDNIYLQLAFDINALRPMPKYGTPYL